MNNPRELLDRPIPGITAKQLLAVAAVLVTLTGFYIDIKRGVSSGRKERSEILSLIKEMREEQKQDRKIDDSKIHAIELQIRECKIRLDIMEKFIEGYSKPLK